VEVGADRSRQALARSQAGGSGYPVGRIASAGDLQGQAPVLTEVGAQLAAGAGGQAVAEGMREARDPASGKAAPQYFLECRPVRGYGGGPTTTKVALEGGCLAVGCPALDQGPRKVGSGWPWGDREDIAQDLRAGEAGPLQLAGNFLGAAQPLARHEIQ